MSEAKFKKGEWVIRKIDNQFAIMTEETGYGICSTVLCDSTDKANAHLIAAAPRTYNAADALIKSVMERYGLDSIDELQCPLMRELAISLVQARGESC